MTKKLIPTVVILAFIISAMAEEKNELIGTQAPSIYLFKLSSNKYFRSKDLLGKKTLVVSFFATWCQPCMKELPHLQNLYEKYQGQDVKFFLIDITEATRSVEGFEQSPQAGPFLAEKGITIPTLIDIYGMAKRNYGATTLPRLFVIDKLRKIRLHQAGFHEGEDFEGKLSTLVDELLAENFEK